MKIIIILFSGITIMTGCKDNKTTTGSTGQPAKDSAIGKASAEDFSGCYRRVLARDTFLARFEQHNDRVTGNLEFDNFEKDQSSGVVNGKKDGDIIELQYTFQSEGMTSVMEVYFKLIAGGIIRGIGDMVVRNDTVYYKDPGSIRYPEGEKWEKVECSGPRQL